MAIDPIEQKSLLSDIFNDARFWGVVGLLGFAATLTGKLSITGCWLILISALSTINISVYRTKNFNVHRHRYVIIIVSSILVGIYGFWLMPGPDHVTAIQHIATSKPNNQSAQPPTFEQMFDHDFPNYYGTGRQLCLQNGKSGVVFPLKVRLLIDPASRTEFLAVFLAADQNAASNAMLSILNPRVLIEGVISHIGMSITIPGNSEDISISQMIFTNTIYFYMQRDLSLDDMAKLNDTAERNGILTEFRGRAYYILHWTDPNLISNIKNESTKLPTACPLASTAQ